MSKLRYYHLSTAQDEQYQCVDELQVRVLVLTVLQKQEFESMSKRVDDLTNRNQDKIESLSLRVNSTLSQMREENDKTIEKMRNEISEMEEDVVKGSADDDFNIELLGNISVSKDLNSILRVLN